MDHLRSWLIDELRRRFPLVNDHPDVAGVLRQPDLLAALGPALAAPFVDRGVDLVVAPEARGPIVGALTATALDAGLVLARKDDRNHPGADVVIESEPTWRGGSETFQLRSFDLESARPRRALLVDDWITTGSSLRAAKHVLEAHGIVVLGSSVLVNKADPAVLRELGVDWLVTFSEVMGGR